MRKRNSLINGRIEMVKCDDQNNDLEHRLNVPTEYLEERNQVDAYLFQGNSDPIHETRGNHYESSYIKLYLQYYFPSGEKYSKVLECQISDFTYCSCIACRRD